MMNDQNEQAVDTSELLPYWEALLNSADAHEQIERLEALNRKLEKFNRNATFRRIYSRQRSEHYRRGLLGFYVEAAFPEENIPNVTGGIVRRFLASFAAEQEQEMIAFLEAWLEEHYPGMWKRKESDTEPLYEVTHGIWGFKVFSTVDVKDGSTFYARWKANLR